MSTEPSKTRLFLIYIGQCSSNLIGLNKPFVRYFPMKLLLSLALIIITLTSCRNRNDGITWEYTVPDGYIGWLAIQYDCPDGTPLNRQDNVIQVEFGNDGLFCTSDSSFPWRGQKYATSNSGNRIPIYPEGEVGYGICCGQTLSTQFSADGQQIEVILDLMWVGNLENGYPPLDVDAIEDDATEGQLVPADW